MKKLISIREHRRVLKTCVDVPNKRPSFSVPLGEVGISAKTLWVLLPQGRIPFSARLSVNLPGNLRGIHMSRMEEVISSLYDRNFSNLKEYAVELGMKMVSLQRGKQGKVILEGKLPLLRPTSVEGRSSVDSVDINLTAEFTEKNKKIKLSEMMIEAGVNHITACPCTQDYNQVLFKQNDGPCPMPTHSQRSHTTLSLASKDDLPDFENLFDCLGSTLHVTRDLLKRPDEAEIILRSHRHPQFAEDTVRETARAAAMWFNTKVNQKTRVIIESVSLESIHIHDVRCRLETTMGKLTDHMRKDRKTPQPSSQRRMEKKC